jgi:hypothetical protein
MQRHLKISLDIVTSIYSRGVSSNLRQILRCRFDLIVTQLPSTRTLQYGV